MLKKEILKLLKEDEEFRYAVAGLIGLDKILDELKKLWEEIKALREGQEKLWEENRRIWEEIKALRENQEKLWKSIEKLWEKYDQLAKGQEKLWGKYDQLAKDQEKLWEKYDQLARGQEKLWEKYDQLAKGQEKLWEENRKIWEEIKALREDFSAMNRKLDALGARWGIMSEAAFRETLKGILEKDFKARVERWVYNDEEGFVFGYPGIVEIDLVIKDHKIIIVEVKSHIRESDISILYRKAKFYEKITGRKPDEIIASSPYIDESAKNVCQKLGIRIYTV